MSFSSRLGLALVSAALLGSTKCDDVGSGDTLGRFTLRVSVDVHGQQALGDSTNLSISADGRFVAFESTAANLTNDDSNGVQDIFVKDRLTGAVERVSVNTVGIPLPGFISDSFSPSISADGRYVVWSSMGDFGGGSVNSHRQIHLHDRLTHQTRRVTSELSNTYDCEFPSVAVTPAGQVFVAFKSKATTDFITGLQGGPYTFPPGGPFVQIWVANVTNPMALTIRCVSTFGASANAADADCGTIFSGARLSADGSALVFSTAARLDFANDPDGNTDIYLTSPNGGAPALITLDINGLKLMDGDFPAVSGDGRFVAFTCMHNIDRTLADYGATQILVRDRTAATTLLISQSAAGLPANNGCGFPTISGDGQRIAYTTTASNLLGSVPSVPQIMVSSPAGPLLTASVDPSGAFGNFLNKFPALSGDGKWVAWHTNSNNLIVNDTNFTSDIYVHGPLP